MSGVMMLNYLDESGPADKIRNAYDAVLTEHNPEKLTADLGGTAGTEQFTDAIIQAMV